MPFPSIAAAIRRASESFDRFPVAVLSGALAAAVAVSAIEGPSKPWHGRMLATAILGLTLSTALTFTAERRAYAPLVRRLLTAGLLLALALLYLASLEWTDPLTIIRFAPLLVSAHLLVAAGPFLGGGSQMEFWQFNRCLFLRFLTATIYAAVLWGGLAIALAAVDKLFGANIPNETYPKLWAVFAFGFHPWFFLSGVPEDFAELDRREDYPLGLKVFAQFVLIPLVTVYLLILTAYLGKVLITRTWPSGWIGYLVSCVSAVGVLALLLVHPVRTRTDSAWVNAYGRWWFVAIVPSLIMLLVAIGKRVDQYGITEPRYFLLVLALWMLCVALYYGASGATTIKPIPASLAVVILLTTAGPWSATAISIRSQRHRLTTLLEANGMGRAGAPIPAKAAVSVRDRREMSAVLRYLERTHGRASVASAMGVSIDSASRWPTGDGRPGDFSSAGRAMQSLGVEYLEYYGPPGEQNQFWARVQDSRTMEVGGFEIMRSISYPTLGWIGSSVDSLEASVGVDSATVVLRHAGDSVLTLDVAAAVRAALENGSLTEIDRTQLARPVITEGDGGGYRARLVLEFLSGRMTPGGPVLTTGSGYLLVAGLKTPRQ